MSCCRRAQQGPRRHSPLLDEDQALSRVGGARAGRGGSPGRGAVPKPERRRFFLPADFKEDEEAGFVGLPFIQPEGDDEWMDNVPWEEVPEEAAL